MPWVRLEDTFPEHPKIAAVGGDAAWLHVCAIAYCNRNTTDGFIAAAMLPRLSDRKGARKLAETLVDEHLWEIDQRGGWVIHDYLDYNPTRQEVEAERARKSQVKADAGKLGGIASGVARRKHNGSKPEAELKQTVKQTGSKTKPRPDPTRPIPSNSHFDTSSSSARTPLSDDEKCVKEALDLYAESEAKARADNNEAGYKATVIANGHEHLPIMRAMIQERPDCTPAELARAYTYGAWPRIREARGHDRNCACRGTRQIRDAAGYAEPCHGDAAILEPNYPLLRLA